MQIDATLPSLSLRPLLFASALLYSLCCYSLCRVTRVSFSLLIYDVSQLSVSQVTMRGALGAWQIGKQANLQLLSHFLLQLQQKHRQTNNSKSNYNCNLQYRMQYSCQQCECIRCIRANVCECVCVWESCRCVLDISCESISKYSFTFTTWFISLLARLTEFRINM